MGTVWAPVALLQFSCFFCSLYSSSWFFLPSILEHLFLHKIERGLMSFYTQNKQQFHSKFHKSMISMYCSFHLKFFIFLSMCPQKSCTIQDKCEVKYVKLWSLSATPPQKIGIKAKNTPEVSTQEHWVYGSFLRGKYTLEAIKMRQICPTVKKLTVNRLIVGPTSLTFLVN